MDLDETWQVGLRPCTFPAKSRYGFQRKRENGSQRRSVLWRVRRSTCLLPLSLDRFPPNIPWTRVQVVARDIVVSHSRKVSTKGTNFPKNRLFGVPYLWPAYGSRETFCDAYTVSIPWWASHRCALPWWLLLRDVPFSSYPRPLPLPRYQQWRNLDAYIFSNILARGRHDRIADLHWYTTPVHIF